MLTADAATRIFTVLKQQDKDYLTQVELYWRIYFFARIYSDELVKTFLKYVVGPPFVGHGSHVKR